MKNLFAFFELILYGSIFFGGLVAQRESAVEDLVFPKTFHLKSWKAIIYPLSLKIYGQKDNGPLILIGSAKENEFNDPIHVHDTENSMEILYPHMKVRISSKEDRVHFHFELEKSCDIAWPVSGVDPHNKAIIYPDGEGLYVPVNDSFWKERLNDSSMDTEGNGLSMPFYGYETEGETIGYILHSAVGNELKFLVNHDRLNTILIHHSGAFEKKHDYEISLALCGNSPLGPAWNYKNYLIAQGKYKSLAEKEKENPDIRKLFGALHVYLWGDGRTSEFLTYINKLGIDRLWLGYTTELEEELTDKNAFPINSVFIHEAKALGYLVGPYDEFYTMMHPDVADCPNVIFKGMYPAAAIVDSNGERRKGFDGRGYCISSEALALQDNKVIYDRVENFLKTGINSYFLDCDAFGELFDDFAQDHSMDKIKDRENRLIRMAYIANKRLVLGSESAVAWAVPALSFAHGNFSVNNTEHWNLRKDAEFYGVRYPQNRPDFFFKTINVPDDYITSKYDPCYRLPLFQAVFHEAIVTTDRWDISHMKFANIAKVRELLELFYGIPSIWALDLQDAGKYEANLKKLFSFFSPLHKAIATEPITSFTWLTQDRKVQQIVFGDTLRLIVNFSNARFQEIPAGSLGAYWLKRNSKEIYTPQ